MMLLVNSEKTNLYIEHFNKSLSGEYNIVKNREETYIYDENLYIKNGETEKHMANYFIANHLTSFPHYLDPELHQ